MHVLLFGATGMIGQSALRECLRAPDVERVTTVVRKPTDATDPKVREIVHQDFHDFSAVADQLAQADACLYCLGVASAGLTEAEYTRITYGIALAAGEALVARNPRMRFVFISGAGAVAAEQGGTMWGRVKGHTENALRKLPFAQVVIVRPAFVQPLHGVTSRTALYRAAYVLTAPLAGLLPKVAPGLATTSEHLGLALLEIARHGADKAVLESKDIHALGQAVLERGANLPA